MTLEPTIARQLRRRDLSRSALPAATVTRPGGNAGKGDTIAAFSGQSTIGPARAKLGVSLDTGTVSIGMLGVVLIGLAGFYYWTRGHQA